MGPRTLLAMTCKRCGVLRQGSEFVRYRRKARDKVPYLDLRCKPCRFAGLGGSPREMWDG